MRILAVGHCFVNHDNAKFLTILARRGHVVKIISPEYWLENSQKMFQKKIDELVEIQVLPTVLKSNLTIYFYLFGLTKQVIRFKPDVIEFFEEPWSFSLFQICILKRLFFRKIPIVCYSAQNIYKNRWFPFNFIEWFNLKTINAIHVCNTEVVKVLREKGYKRAIEMIPLGIDFGKFSLKQLVATDVLSVGFSGRFIKEKDIITLIKATEGLSGVRLLLAGSGPEEESLKRYVHDKKLSEQVEFFGVIPFEKVEEFYQKIDVLVLPTIGSKSYKEQFGRVLLEAMAVGCIVIGSNEGSIPEVIEDKGLIFQAGNVEDLKAKIIEVKKDLTKLNRNRLAIRDWVIKKYSWDNVTDMYESMYKGVSSDRV